MTTRTASPPEDPKGRRSQQVPLNDEAARVLAEIRDETGMTQVAFLQRILEWYTEQPLSVQREIRDRRGDAGRELARLRLAEMAAAGEADLTTTAVTFDDAARLARKMIDRLAEMGAVYQQELKARLAAGGGGQPAAPAAGSGAASPNDPGRRKR